MTNNDDIMVVTFPDGNFMSLPRQLLGWLGLNRAVREAPNEFSPPGIVKNLIRGEVAIFIEERPDEHFSIQPVWTSSSEVLILEWRYLKILVWDQQFFQYMAATFAPLFFEDDDVGRKHIRGWLITYISERLMNRTPARARYYFELHKNFFPAPTDNTSFSRETPAEDFSAMSGYFRRFVLYHELGHMRLLAKVGFRSVMEVNYKAISELTQKIIEARSAPYLSQIKEHMKPDARIVYVDESTRLLIDATPSKKDELLCDIYAIFSMLNILIEIDRAEFPRRAALFMASINLHLQVLYELQQSRLIHLGGWPDRVARPDGEMPSIENILPYTLRETHIRQSFAQATLLAYLSHKAEDMAEECSRLCDSYLSVLNSRVSVRLHFASLNLPPLPSQDEAAGAISDDGNTVLSDFKVLLGWG
jgi:hypothetical protein